MESRGLGDTIRKITKATGIKKLVDIVSEKLDIPCGCEDNQEYLNELLPYKKNKKNEF